MCYWLPYIENIEYGKWMSEWIQTQQMTVLKQVPVLQAHIATQNPVFLQLHTFRCALKLCRLVGQWLVEGGDWRMLLVMMWSRWQRGRSCLAGKLVYWKRRGRVLVELVTEFCFTQSAGGLCACSRLDGVKWDSLQDDLVLWTPSHLHFSPSWFI